MKREKYTNETLFPRIEKIDIKQFLNAFLEEERAIVTNIPGTTHDVVEGRFILDGIILNIIGTVGIRETEDVVKKIDI